MTKKEDKLTKDDFPVVQAIYPYRCGLEVCVVIWLDRIFIKGKIISTYSITHLDEPGSIHYYNIQINSGEVFEGVEEEDVFITRKLLMDTISKELKESTK